MKRPIFARLFIAISFVFALLVGVQKSSATEVSGMISLPVGVSAFTMDRQFWIDIWSNWNNSYPQSNTNCGPFTLEANQQNALYHCTIDDSTGEIGVGIGTWGWSDELYNSHYYSSIGTQFSSNKAEHLVAGGSYTGINITLLKQKVVQGGISTPNGEIFTEDIKFCPAFYYQQPGSSYWSGWGSQRTILAGANYVDYTLNIPETAFPIKIGYFWCGGNPPQGYMSSGYYNQSGTKFNQSEGEILAIDNSLTGLNMTLLKGIPLNGTVYLPDGETNSQAVNVSVQCNTSTYSTYLSQNVTIPAGGNSTDFSFSFPPDNQVMCRYYAVSGADRAYLTPGYYSQNGTTKDYSQASWISTTSPEHISLTLLPGVAISGTISLPAGLTYANTINGGISIRGLDGSYIQSLGYSIPQGQSSVNWQSTIAKTNQEVIVEVSIYKYQYDPDPAYLYTSYYNSNGSVGLREHATPITSLTNQSNVNITLLKGKIISGTITLISPDTFPGEGNISLTADWGSGGTSSWLNSLAGQASTPFSIAVPPDAPNYTLKYSQWAAPPQYLQSGYYNSNQSGYCASDAYVFISGVDYPNTNITLLKGNTVKGSVSLPNSTTELVDIPISLGSLYLPADGQYATTLSGSYQTSVLLPANTNSVTYEVALPPTCSENPGNFLFGYNQNNEKYVHFGYFNHEGTVGLISNSELLPPRQNHTEINLQLIEGNLISGIISLPNGATAPPEGLSVTLGTPQEPNGLYHTTVTVAPGATSAPYAIRVAPDVGNVALSYWMLGNMPYATRGYYSATPTTSNVTGRYDFAAQYALATNNYSNQNFTLDAGNQVSGTIHTPTASIDDTPIVVTLAHDPADPKTVYWNTVVNVGAGLQAVSYSQRIVLDSSIVAKYTNSLNQQWTPVGYYFDSTKSVRSVAQATPLNALADHSFVDFFLNELLRGDLNYSGAVDLTDAILGLQIMTGRTLFDDITKLADVNGDGIISMPEVIFILHQL